MKKESLPIGTVVMLRGATKPSMVTGYKMKDGNNPDELYDYVGCVFPEGLMEEIFVLFNQEQIEDVLFVGYSDEEFKEKGYNINNKASNLSANGGPNVSNGGNGRVRKPRRRPPTNPLSASEMFAKYTKEVISGGETDKFDMDNLK